MKLIQVLLTVISVAAAGPQNYDFLKPIQNSDNTELYGILKKMLDRKQAPTMEDYLEKPLVSSRSYNETPVRLNNEQIVTDENIFAHLNNAMTERPEHRTNTQISEEPVTENDNNEESLIMGLLENTPEPKQTIRLNIPGYTVINVNGQPKLVKQEELFQGNKNEPFVRSESLTVPSLHSTNEDGAASQEQKLALLSLYIKEGKSIPRLANGDIDWSTIVSTLKENDSAENKSSESDEEETPSDLNDKLMRMIKQVKESLSKLPDIEVNNMNFRHLMNKESSEKGTSDGNKWNSGHRLDVLKNYLKSGGSIPFVASSKTIRDGFLNNIINRKEKTTTANAPQNKPSHGIQDQMEMFNLYHKLDEPTADDKINWGAVMNNRKNDEKEERTATPVKHPDNIVINYDTLNMKDLLEMMKDISKPGMTTDKIVKYLHEKQRDIESRTENHKATRDPTWIPDEQAYKLGNNGQPYFRQKKEVQLKRHMPHVHSYHLGKYDY